MKNVHAKYVVFFALSVVMLATALFYTFVIKRYPPAAPQAQAEEETETPPEETVKPDNLPPPQAESTAVDLSEAGVIAVAKPTPSVLEIAAQKEKENKFRPITLSSADLTVVAGDAAPANASGIGLTAVPSTDADSARTMLTAPVGYKIISTQADYDNFKKTAFGNFPKIDFTKQSFLYLESQGSLPDNIFEIRQVRTDNGVTTVDFDVNILGLKDRTASHAYAAVDKSVKSVNLNQVM